MRKTLFRLTTLKLSLLSAFATLFLLVAMLASTGTASAHTASRHTPSLKPHGAMSGGGCWSYHTFSTNATFENTAQPVVYGIENSQDAPQISVAFNFCSDYILVKIYPEAQPSYDYYKVDWWTYGRHGWSQVTTKYTVASFAYVWHNSQYEFVVDACTSHWYGDSCTDWSPYVFIATN